MKEAPRLIRFNGRRFARDIRHATQVARASQTRNARPALQRMILNYFAASNEAHRGKARRCFATKIDGWKRPAQ
jgi:hypothetical protein